MIFKFILIILFVLPIHWHVSSAPEDTLFRISVNHEQLSAPEVLSIYIQHKSLSYEELNAGEWLKSVCRENDLNIYNFGTENGNYNFAASLFPLDRNLPNIILLNHIDVIDAGDPSIWKYPPFSGFITDDEVWGRGAFDNKGAAIMQLFSLLKFKHLLQNTEIKYNVTFLAASCEETMCEGGIEYVLKNHLEELNPITVIGEGATELSELIDSKKNEFSFGISVGHKRPLWLELTLNTPSSGHSSITPTEYSTKEMTIALANLVKKKTPAIYFKENQEILRFVGDSKKGISKFILKHPVLFKPLIVSRLRKEPELFALFTNTISITSIETDNKVFNKIPQSTKAYLDCRLLPEASQEKFLKSLKRTLKNDNIEVKIIKKMDLLPISTTENVFYKSLELAIIETYGNVNVMPIILPNFSDVGNFRLKGIDSYSIIPVVLDIDYLRSIHAENERLPISALHQGIDVYYNFLKLTIK